MTVLLNRAFVGFDVGRGLSALDRVSEHRNQQSLMRLQQQQYDVQAQTLADRLEVHEEVQRELVEIQTVAMDGLAEAIEIGAEAQEAMAEDFQDEQEALRAVMQTIEESLERLVGQLSGVLAIQQDKASHSAGGLLGQLGQALDALKGWPWATGDLKLTFNNPPRGWLVCDGTTRRRSEYPELGYLIGGKFGGGGDGDFFRLPSKSELTDDTKVLALDALRFCIRY
ncbi:MAG: tail fiber protein [Phycisphaerae bacterium]|nr:tail fiber protein [Phycisphaerae bacterium]